MDTDWSLQEHFGAHRGAEISSARIMVTTRNQENQRPHSEGNPTTMLAEVMRELEAIRRLGEEERRPQIDAFEILQFENERLRQRLDRVERERVRVTPSTELNSQRESREETSQHHEQRYRSVPHESRGETSHRWDGRESPRHNSHREEHSRHESRKGETTRREGRVVAREEISRVTTGNTTAQYPFTDEIMAIRLPKGWKNQSLDRYDGSTDPDEHLNAYVAQLSIYTTDTHVFCKVFPASLRGAALSWFTQLTPQSIDSFDSLKAKFAAQFATSRSHHLTQNVHMVNSQLRRSMPDIVFTNRDFKYRYLAR